jgi:predicted AAA+ superfamily ATPase
MLHQVQPWYENIGKRQVRSPKIYFRDSGLLHALINIDALVKSRISDGFVKSSQARRANPEE